MKNKKEEEQSEGRRLLPTEKGPVVRAWGETRGHMQGRTAQSSRRRKVCRHVVVGVVVVVELVVVELGEGGRKRLLSHKAFLQVLMG